MAVNYCVDQHVGGTQPLVWVIVECKADKNN